MTMTRIPEIAKRKMEKRDPLLRWTGRAARSVLARINQLPRGQRADELRRVLTSYEPGLPAIVEQSAVKLHAAGMPLNGAMERALALGLADATIVRMQKLGRARMRNEFFPLGGLGEAAQTAAGQDAGQIVEGMFRGVACSDDLRTSVTDLVLQSNGGEAAQASTVGFEVAKGMAQCSSAPDIPDAPPAPEDRDSLVLPIVVGIGALAVAGGVAYYVTKKR
jgi:hypothetical protein